MRTIKAVNLKVRPMHPRTEARVRAHIFLCTPAWHVEGHMREAWRPLLFGDTAREEGFRTRDPVAPAERSENARRKASRATLDDGTPVHCFRTLIEALETMTSNQRRISTPDHETAAATFEITTRANETQQRALDLIGAIGNLSQPPTGLQAERRKPNPAKPPAKQHTEPVSGFELQPGSGNRDIDDANSNFASLVGREGRHQAIFQFD